MPISFCRTNWNWRAIFPISAHGRPVSANTSSWHGINRLLEAPPKVWDHCDILTELADRVGFLDEYNEELNKEIGFSENSPDKLLPGKKYAWAEIVSRQCSFFTNGKYDLEWFKKNSMLARPVSVEEQYDIHLGMKAKKLRYQIPYMEVVKRTGDELERNLAQQGIDWWPTDEYTALPTYFSRY